MEQGKVKWFDPFKGYGFVRTDTRTDDIFVHYSSIQCDGFRTLEEGQDVRFRIERGGKGLAAFEVEVIDA